MLLSRHGVQTTAQAECVSALREDGADVWVVSADVADRTQVAQTLARIASEGLPLAGVVHAAGVLDDGLLMQQTAARFDQVLRPKVAGHGICQSLRAIFRSIFLFCIARLRDFWDHQGRETMPLRMHTWTH